MQSKAVFWVLNFLLLFNLSCNDQKEARETKELSQKWDAIGVIYAIEKEGNTIVISHEAMPGLMGAMTMRFAVKNQKDIEGLQAEDKISFVVTMSKGEYVAGNIRKAE